MHLSQFEKITFLASLASIYLIAWILQQQLFLNWDVSLLITASRRWLEGGNYIDDFFTPNPPMILYLYALPVIMTQLCHLSIMLMFKIYMFLIISFSLFMCYPLLKAIFCKQNKILFFVIFMSMAAVFLLLPFHQFGQRDHLVVIMIMPYLLLVSHRLEGGQAHWTSSLLIGLFAGLGVGIKPHFLLTPIFIELYFIVKQQNWLSWFRVETISALSLLILYAALTLVIHPEYHSTIVPYAFHYYYQSIGVPWFHLAFHYMAVYAIAAIFFYLVQRKETTHQALSTILFLSTITFLLAYFLQGTFLVYHLIPAFSFSILLFVLLFSLFLEKHLHVFSIFLGILIFAFPVHASCYLYQFGLAFKHDKLNYLIAFMRTQAPHQTIYSFSESVVSFPLNDYVEARAPQRFDSLWMLKYYIKLLDRKGETAIRHELQNEDKLFFLNLIAKDLHQYKPDLIFVDTSKNNISIGTRLTHFDFIDYFLENANFRKEWKAYYHLVTLSNLNQYQISVYKRSDRNY